MKPIYVFGHKNPDTDSVCSAIALSYLKNQTGYKTIPKVIGPINRETRFVLDYFGVDAPSYLNDVRVEINDTNYTKKAIVNENDSIYDAFNFMKSLDLTAVPLVNDHKKLTGYVTLKSMAKYLMMETRDVLDTNLKLLLKTIEGKIITNFRKNFNGTIITAAFSSDSFINEVKLSEDNILIVGDRYKVLEYAIESKVQLLILSKNRLIPTKLLNKAIKNKVSIVSSKYSSFELSQKLTHANYIKTINDTSSPLTINIHGYYTDFLSLTKKYNYTNYPVIKKSGECVGVLKLTDSFEYQKKKVILVDHNNYEQSIDGITEAEIVEVFDHHNIGNIGTNIPIYFTCRPVGCTATIIYEAYKKEDVKVPRQMAGLLLSAILSDTLLLTSPTTTDIDRKYAKELSNILKLDIEKYGIEMLKAASSIKGLSVTELINQDFKQYNVNDKLYGIAVITTMDYEEIAKDMNKYISKLDEMSYNTYEGVLLFITDVIKQGSYVIYNTSSKNLISNAFNVKDIKEGTFLDGVVSRKKQILPALLKELEK